MDDPAVKTEYPPNILLIRQVLPATDNQVFTYWPHIYNPSGKPLDPDLLIHEEIHLKQQEGNPEEWWNRYLTDKEFRYQEELIAFATQLTFGRKTYRRKITDQMETDFALQLSGELYNTGRTYQEAAKDIREKLKQYKETA